MLWGFKGLGLRVKGLGLMVLGWDVLPVILAVLKRDSNRGYYTPYSGLCVAGGTSQHAKTQEEPRMEQGVLFERKLEPTLGPFGV